jgi:hypothetical protein
MSVSHSGKPPRPSKRPNLSRGAAVALPQRGQIFNANQWIPDHRAKSVHVVQRVFRHESSVRSTLAIPIGPRGWPGPMRVVPTHRALGRPAQRRIDHAGSNCAVAEFGDLRANSRCILGARPAPHQKALSGARHRQRDRRNGTDFADGDFLVACHHGSWIGSRYEALTSRRARSTSSASLSSMRMILLFAAPSAFRSSSSLA